MNVDENYRHESIRFYLQKYSLINKLNNLRIEQHYYCTFSGLNLGTSLESKWV